MISWQPWLSPRLIVLALLSVGTAETDGKLSIQLIPERPVIQGSVTLRVTGVTGNIRTVTWYKGPDTSAQNQILGYYFLPSHLPPQSTGPQYHDRMKFFPNGSLLISNLNNTDGGNYIVKVQTEDPATDADVILTVYEKVGKPTITGPTTYPKENDPVTLTCTSTNAEMIVWKKDSSSLPNGTTLSADNKTVTFNRINRTASGQYQCEAENPVSKDTSDLYILTVAYGPENVKIEARSAADSVSLTCFADSVPPPTYRWSFNGTDLIGQQNKVSVDKKKPENEGNYTCVAYNNITQKNASLALYVNSTFESPLDEDGSGGNKTLGTIIGIVIAVVLLLALVAAVVYLFIVHRRRKKALNERNSTDMSKTSSRNGAAVNSASAEPPELQYASIDFSNNVPKKKQPSPPESVYANRVPQEQPPPPDTIVYSELRIN